MFKRRLRLPSPALVISMVALSLVLGGTAVAATKGSHDDAKADKALIKKLAPSLSVKNAKQLAGQPASSYEAKSSLMWASITNNGTTAAVARSSPGVTAVRHSEGEVWVTFPRDVSGCAWIATQGNPVSAFVPGEFATVRGNGTSTQVYVVTYDHTATETDANFHIVVSC